MPFQVNIAWDENDTHPAFADLEQAISFAKGLLARLPKDAHRETEVTVLDAEGTIVSSYTLIAWQFAVLMIGDEAYARTLEDR